MSKLIELVDRGFLPDRLIRIGIRHLDKKRLQAENCGEVGAQRQALDRFIEEMRQSPVAVQTFFIEMADTDTYQSIREKSVIDQLNQFTQGASFLENQGTNALVRLI